MKEIITKTKQSLIEILDLQIKELQFEKTKLQAFYNADGENDCQRKNILSIIKETKKTINTYTTMLNELTKII